MAVFLGVRSDLLIVVVNYDAHLGQQLHLLLVQVICGYLRHAGSRSQESDLPEKEHGRLMIVYLPTSRLTFYSKSVISASV